MKELIRDIVVGLLLVLGVWFLATDRPLECCDMQGLNVLIGAAMLAIYNFFVFKRKV